jgi:hypothetical protein
VQVREAAVDGFDPDAYVVRAGWRGFCVMLLALLGWSWLGAVALLTPHLTYAAAKIAILGVCEIVFLADAVLFVTHCMRILAMRYPNVDNLCLAGDAPPAMLEVPRGMLLRTRWAVA